MTAARLAPSHAPRAARGAVRPADGRRPVPRPFVKWVGGKRQIMGEILRRLGPLGPGARYFEPFLGGGAVFFELAPARAVLADSNRRLVGTWKGIKDDVEGVIRLLRRYEKDHLDDPKTFFYQMRAQPDARMRAPARLAAWFVYLNKTGFNGLYRVNSRDVFNVPLGRYAKPPICDEDNLRACAAVLAGGDIEIRCCDFEAAVADARAGDVVYFDPPYVPLTRSANFTSYTAGGFSDDRDQVRLRDLARRLVRAGVRVVLSNSSADLVKDLYQGRDFTLHEVQANRTLNSRTDRRGALAEVIIVGNTRGG